MVLVLLPSLYRTFLSMRAKEWLSLMTQSLIGVLGMTLCYFYAVSQVGVSMAVALLYIAPVFSLVLAKLILGEQISVKSALLAIIAVIGAACLMAGDKFSLNMGVVVGLLSGLCYSLYGILGKKPCRSITQHKWCFLARWHLVRLPCSFYHKLLPLIRPYPPYRLGMGLCRWAKSGRHDCAVFSVYDCTEQTACHDSISLYHH